MLLNFLAGLVLAVNGQTYVCNTGEVFNYLNIQANDVTVIDCHLRDSGVRVTAVSVAGNRVTLRGLLIERSGGAGVAFFSGTGSVLEDSVIRDPVTRQGEDSWGIYSASSGSITIRRNTVHGSGFSTYAPGGSSLIEDNRFIVPEDYRTDCNGNPQRDGPCQCAEFGIALKSGNSVIRHNVMEGYRQSDPICGGSGSPGAGISVAACGGSEICPTDNVVIERNIIRNSHFAIYVGPRSTNLRIEANIVCSSDYGISDGFGAPSTIIDNEFSDNTVNLNLYGSRTGPVSGNLMVPVLGGCLIGELLDQADTYPSRPTIFLP